MELEQLKTNFARKAGKPNVRIDLDHLLPEDELCLAELAYLYVNKSKTSPFVYPTAQLKYRTNRLSPLRDLLFYMQPGSWSERRPAIYQHKPLEDLDPRVLKLINDVIEAQAST